MVNFALSIFLSAFLLFQVQPMIGKFILPWFGGTPAVWSTVMLFFQVLLTGGYAYAYWLMGRARKPAIVHVSLLALAVALLAALSLVWKSPITPDASWRPQDVSSPVLHIFTLLAISVGLPYFLLASNSPLMQAWFSRVFPERSYARLYSLSNVGSLLGLLTYPFLVEPNLSLQSQGWMWAGGFVLFGLFAGWIAVQNGRAEVPLRSKPTAAPVPSGERPSASLMTLWIALSGTASIFLLSVTNQITQEVAVIPFLWVLPLALYLLSFILTFSGERGYHRNFYSALFLLATAGSLYVMLNVTSLHVSWQILAYCTLLFAACMLCHGELYLLRPQAGYLTTFYLMVSIGGALGGLFVSLAAPVIFNGYWELFVGLAMTIAVLLMILRGGREIHERARFVIFVFGLVTVLLYFVGTYFSGALFNARNFYGVVRVKEDRVGNPGRPVYLMAHGVTIHGMQFIGEGSRSPTTYFVNSSGVGLALLNHPRHGQGMRVGILGVGIGTLTSYGQPGDVYRLYEINPVVTDLAEGEGGFFSYVRDSQADVQIVLGDGRISLERELAENGSQNFDVLILDAFSSDSVPVHLITKEAFDMYLQHLAPHAIIAANITNLHLDLQPVFWQLARHYGLSMVRINYNGDSNGGYTSHWILLARDPALLEIPEIQNRAVDLSGYSTTLRMWTDDYSNLFQILK